MFSCCGGFFTGSGRKSGVVTSSSSGRLSRTELPRFPASNALAASSPRRRRSSVRSRAQSHSRSSPLQSSPLTPSPLADATALAGAPSAGRDNRRMASSSSRSSKRISHGAQSSPRTSGTFSPLALAAAAAGSGLTAKPPPSPPLTHAGAAAASKVPPANIGGNAAAIDEEDLEVGVPAPKSYVRPAVRYNAEAFAQAMGGSGDRTNFNSLRVPQHRAAAAAAHHQRRARKSPRASAADFGRPRALSESSTGTRTRMSLRHGALPTADGAGVPMLAGQSSLAAVPPPGVGALKAREPSPLSPLVPSERRRAGSVGSLAASPAPSSSRQQRSAAGLPGWRNHRLAPRAQSAFFGQVSLVYEGMDDDMGLVRMVPRPQQSSSSSPPQQHRLMPRQPVQSMTPSRDASADSLLLLGPSGDKISLVSPPDWADDGVSMASMDSFAGGSVTGHVYMSPRSEISGRAMASPRTVLLEQQQQQQLMKQQQAGWHAPPFVRSPLSVVSIDADAEDDDSATVVDRWEAARTVVSNGGGARGGRRRAPSFSSVAERTGATAMPRAGGSGVSGASSGTNGPVRDSGSGGSGGLRPFLTYVEDDGGGGSVGGAGSSYSPRLFFPPSDDDTSSPRSRSNSRRSRSGSYSTSRPRLMSGSFQKRPSVAEMRMWRLAVEDQTHL